MILFTFIQLFMLFYLLWYNFFFNFIHIKIYKFIFNSRYRARNTEFKNQVTYLIKGNNKKLEESFYKNEKIEKKIKILFTIFYHIPATYNMFRWINEKRAR